MTPPQCNNGSYGATPPSNSNNLYMNSTNNNNNNMNSNNATNSNNGIGQAQSQNHDCNYVHHNSYNSPDIGFYNRNCIEQTLSFLGQITGTNNGNNSDVMNHNATSTTNTDTAGTTSTTNHKGANGNATSNTNPNSCTSRTSSINYNSNPTMVDPAPAPTHTPTLTNTKTTAVPELSPTSAALSTAAAVAAMKFPCIQLPTPTDTAVCSTDLNRNNHGLVLGQGVTARSSSTGANTGGGSSGGATTAMTIPMHQSNNTRLLTNHAFDAAMNGIDTHHTNNKAATTSNANNNNNFNITIHNNYNNSSQIHSGNQQQLQQLQINSGSANTSSSNTPCATPGPTGTTGTIQHDINSLKPLAPPPGLLLSQNHSHTDNVGNQNLLPQNLLIYNHNHTNNNINHSSGTSTTNSSFSNLNMTNGNSTQHHTITNPNLRHPGAMFTSSLYQQQQQHPHFASPAASKKSLKRNSVPSTAMPSASSTYNPGAVARQMSASSNVFGNMALRRGKWTPEEERFANALIEEFEKGTILDCDNGCTLRAYLSRKLHCAPMRISKKYAGKSIGKHVFLSRIPSLLNRNNGTTLQPHGSEASNSALLRATHENLQKIRDLEFHFHMSLLQEGSACPLGPDISKHLTSSTGAAKGMTLQSINVGLQNPSLSGSTVTVPLSSAPSANGHELGSNVAVNNASFPIIFPSPHANGNNGNAPVSSQAMNNVTQTLPTIAPNFQWFPPGNTPACNSNVANAPVATTVQMQQTLFNTFKEAQTLSSASSEQHQTASANNGNSVGRVPMAEGIPELFSNFQHASNSTPISVVNANVNKDQHNVTNTIDERTQSNQGISVSQAQQNWLTETMHIIPTLDPSSYIGQYSPTYTSQSFDDLHQFIGREFPSTSSTTKSAHLDIKGPATEAANKIEQQDGQEEDNCIASSEADAYSLLAQQSVAAVSKHSAYETNNHVRHDQTSHTLSYNNNNVAQNLLDPTQIFQVSSSTQSKLIQGNQSLLVPTSSTQQDIKSSAPSENIESSSGSGSGSASPQNTGSSKGVEDDASSISFNAANLQLHSAAVAERDRAAAAAADNKELNKSSIKSEDMTKGSDVGSGSTSPSTASSSKFDSTTVLRHANIVSGSDRSSSDNGNESMSGGASGSSGSDNASDNSDAISDEGQSSGSGSSHNRKRRGNTKNCDDVEKLTTKNDNKRQKISTSLSLMVKQEDSDQ